MAAPPASTAAPATRLTPDQAAAFVAAHSGWAAIVGQGVANKLERRGADAEDLRAEAVLKLCEKAPEFIVPARLKPGTTIEDAFRGYLHPHIVGHCRKAAERLVNGGTYHRRGDQADRRPVRGIHIGTGFDLDGRRDDRLTELFTTPPCPTEEDDPLTVDTPLPIPPPALPPPPPALAALNERIKSLRGQAADLEAQASALDELKRMFAPMAVLLVANPTLKGILWSALNGPAKPTAPGGASKRNRNRNKNRPVVAGKGR